MHKCTYVGVSQHHLIESAVRADDKSRAEVRGHCQTGIAAGLHNALFLSLSREHVPLIHRSIHTATDDACVVWTPPDAANLYMYMYVYIHYRMYNACLYTHVAQNYMYRIYMYLHMYIHMYMYGPRCT